MNQLRIWVFLALLTGSAGVVAAENMPFVVGEKLTYTLYWGPFVAGRGQIEVTGKEQFDGHDCYRLLATARTTGLADVLFPVNTKLESWLDAKGLFSHRYREDRKEGQHVVRSETIFDYVNHQMITTNLLKGRTKTTSLTGPVRDVVACLYYVRSQPIALNQLTEFVVSANNTNYVVRMTPNERKVLTLRPLGKVGALRIEPNPTLKLVSLHGGRLWFWVSDDARKVPLLAYATTKYGSIRLVLEDIEPKLALTKEVS